MGSESKFVAEREKTKLRERRRRSITSKILKGLRKHGGYNLRARADINDVLRALAAEAGWVVEPDGTTYRTAPKVSPSSSAEAGAKERSSNGGTPMPFAIGGGDGGGTESSTIAGTAAGSLRAPPAGGLFLSPIRSFGGGFLVEDLCAGTAVEAWAWRQSSQKNV